MLLEQRPEDLRIDRVLVQLVQVEESRVEDDLLSLSQLGVGTRSQCASGDRSQEVQLYAVGSFPDPFQPVDESVDLHLEAKTTLRGLEIEEEVDCHTLGIVSTVTADSGRVRQIMRNLLVNARRYGVSPIRVIVRDAGDAVKVEVRDRGEPIPLDERQAIFDRYYRSRQMPGVTSSVGLGLTVSRELARIMGGDVNYDHDGTESVFTLTLPQAAASQIEVAS